MPNRTTLILITALCAYFAIGYVVWNVLVDAAGEELTGLTLGVIGVAFAVFLAHWSSEGG